MRYRIDLAYKGTQYHGWQEQPNAITVQGEINKALQTVLREKIETVGSGRTDTGVHASCQVLHFDFTKEINFDLTHSLNSLLPKDIVIYSHELVSDEFHARFDPVSRAYRYKILNKHNPFLIDQYLFKRTLPSIELMNEASKEFLNHVDYQCFSKTHTDVHTYNCTIEEAYWVEIENGVEFYIKANRFLRGMVRAVVGTLLDIGFEKKPINHLKEVIESKDRKLAGQAVSANGLFLCEVNYPS